MVGRRGLELRTSAVEGPERCAERIAEVRMAERCAGCYQDAKLPAQAVPYPPSKPGTNDATMRKVDIDPDGTIDDWFGVVVASSTGVLYEQHVSWLP